VFIRRSNQAVVTDLKSRTLRSGTAVAIEDPARCLATVATSNSGAMKQKKDSETNTDNSTLMMLAQRSRLAAEYSGSVGGSGGGSPRPTTSRQRSLTRDRITTASTSTTGEQTTDCTRSSSLGRDSQAGRELQSSRLASDDLDEMAYQYYSSSTGRGGQLSRCTTDDEQGTSAAAAGYHNDISHHLSASGGQYTQSVTVTSRHFPISFIRLCFLGVYK